MICHAGSQQSSVFQDEFAHCQLENPEREMFMELWQRVRNKQSLERLTHLFWLISNGYTL